MMLKTEICPFCDKIFYLESTENDKKNLMIHIKEHHHIDEKRYRMIIAALSDSEKNE